MLLLLLGLVISVINAIVDFVQAHWIAFSTIFWTLLLIAAIALGRRLHAFYNQRQVQPSSSTRTAKLDERRLRRIAEQIRPTSSVSIPNFKVIDGRDDNLPITKDGDTSSRGLTFGIQYGDAVGDVTQRAIRVLSVRRNPSGSISTITAWCYLRKAVRTFRVDRVLAAYDYRTGEVIDDWLSLLSHDEADRASYPGHATVMRKARPGLKVLIWLAQSDLEITNAERQVLLNYVHSCLLDGRTASTFDRIKLLKWADSYKPTSSDAVSAMLSLAKTPARFNTLKEYCVALVKADGSMTRKHDLTWCIL